MPGFRRTLMSNQHVYLIAWVVVPNLRTLPPPICGPQHIYLIAWVVVSMENKDNWKWFLENLKEELHLEFGFRRTLMSY